MKAGLAGFCLLALIATALPATAQEPMRGPDGRYRMVLPGKTPPKPVPAPAAQPDMQPYISPAMPQIDAPLPTGPKPDVIVPVSGGQIGGEAWSDGTFAFKAVPFARPPLGDLRWIPPQDVPAWEGVRFSKDSAPGCLQADYGWQTKISQASSEDCLYLEIRTPSLNHGAKKPVMVFFHGGANRAGSGEGTISSDLGRRDVVIVTLQYRLGVFGFLSHPALTAESANHASGNYALMDQIKALQWLRDNIASFGGDPDNVTIFGHSAGGQDVGLMLASPLARGLFHKAIEESGTPQFGFAPRTLVQNEALGIRLAEQFSQEPADGAKALAGLRHAPAMALQQAGDKLSPLMEDAGFIWDQGTVDGYILPKSPAEIFKAGEGAKVPLIIGVSARELMLADVSASLYGAIATRFGADRGKALRFYKLDIDKTPKRDEVLGDVPLQLSTDLMLRCPADWMARQVTAAGQQAWLYQLDIDADPKADVHHGSELSFVFNDRPKGVKEDHWPRLMDYWVQFAKTGDPNRKGLDDWPHYGRKGSYIEFTRKGSQTEDGMRSDICALLDRP
ncbi:carboxylesterase/lipase family protein [Asticcacaulis sp.]|uniref:carboxylesterase/lipase family protein n=1 Tax=Asticcacaulis sp. TaxID=1872648 RepID=UPI002BFA6E1D|nr:carboxylesterase family protein [Asticcacaulis sp.]HTM80952.1 carboxylesterase family protein [Asticcacaulis sp.]